MTKDSILPEEELLNELMEINQENERPLAPEQLIRALLEIDWDSDEVRIALELYEGCRCQRGGKEIDAL